jgi:hypothetical protein
MIRFLVILLALWATGGIIVQAANPERAVSDGQKVLEDLGPNWYSAQDDAPRPLKVKPEASTTAPSLPAINLNWIGYVALAFLAVVLGAILFALIRALVDSKRKDALLLVRVAGGTIDRTRVESLPFTLAHQDDLLGGARRAYEAGDLRQAVILFYSHLLVSLDRHHVIRLTRGKTNRQYLREMAGRHRLYGLMEQAMVLFEDTFFGGHAVEPPRFEACWRRQAEFDRLVLEGRP